MVYICFFFPLGVCLWDLSQHSFGVAKMQRTWDLVFQKFTLFQHKVVKQDKSGWETASACTQTLINRVRHSGCSDCLYSTHRFKRFKTLNFKRTHVPMYSAPSPRLCINHWLQLEPSRAQEDCRNVGTLWGISPVWASCALHLEVNCWATCTLHLEMNCWSVQVPAISLMASLCSDAMQMAFEQHSHPIRKF